ncbi:MAG: protoporphyrinogen/coproporphyrinogen oxidase [Frankiales bacterium]|nr:protoporphyrinogen/coproporphyrinogen oxidase [Frankiales bacterium]
MTTAWQAEPVAHVVVVGAGIAGLAAAHALSRRAPGLRVTLIEASDRTGGKLRGSDVAGVRVDEGAESVLVRVPEGVDLLREAGLGDEIVHPATTRAALWSRGSLLPLPSGTVMGVPGDLASLESSGVLSKSGLARLALDVVLPRTPIGDDVSVGSYVAARLGREVVDRLVDPLLGGVYAGRADGLSFEATLPQLAPLARTHRSLLRAARLSRASATRSDGPVFASVPGGLGRFAEVLTDVVRAQGADVVTGRTARRMDAVPGAGWRLTVGPTTDETTVEADAVLLATPAAPTARLLTDVAPAAAEALEGIDHASMAIVTLAFEPGPELPALSGWLVPAVEGRLVKAVTLMSRKWPGVTSDVVLVRCSVGRFGDVADLQRTDAELVDGCRADLAEMLGFAGVLLDSRVSRWGGGLPQYAVGHRARVALVRAAVAELPALAVCGAAYDGIGIPACIRSAQAAVDLLLPELVG